MAVILFIEDDPHTRTINRLVFERDGHEVTEARSGPEGIALFSDRKFDLVIVDYLMNGPNGVEVAQQLKATDPSVPIIILSGYGELPGETVGLADRWIIKGGPIQELRDAISALVRHKARDQAAGA